MTDTNEQKWMSDALEACEQHKKNEFDLIRPFEEACFRVGYLAARKKAHSENEDAFKAFALDLVDRYEKEIELLKAELKAEREAVDFYAKDSSWDNADELINYICIVNTDHSEVGVLYDDKNTYFDIHGGKLARSTVKNRRIVL